MGKRRKAAGHRHGLQMVTLCISTTMVLILLGIVVFSVLMARNLSAYVKENLNVTVMLSDTMTVSQTNKLSRSLYKRPYTRHIDYISKQQAQKEQAEAMGSDPSEFLGFNPFSATFEIQLKSDYANCDSLKWISSELRKIPYVTDVAYQEDLMDKVNDNLRKLSIVLLVLAVLLTCVSFSLINIAIMAVPAHDSRDYAFARHFDLPVIPLIEGADVSESSFDAKSGRMINSCGEGLDLNGMEVKDAIAATKRFIKEKGIGKVKVNYRLRDAIFSRQRYWGEPFPVYYKDGIPHTMEISELPLQLPEVEDRKSTRLNSSHLA